MKYILGYLKGGLMLFIEGGSGGRSREKVNHFAERMDVIPVSVAANHPQKMKLMMIMALMNFIVGLNLIEIF